MRFRLIRLFVLAALLWLPSALPNTQAHAQGFTKEQTDQLDALIRDYILRHPEVVVEALTIYQRAQEKADQQAVASNLSRLRDVIENSPDDPVMGNPKGDVTLVEFFDYQCGYCKSMMKPLITLMEEDPQLRLVLKEFPVLGEVSELAARMSMAVKLQNKYEPFHLALMGQRGRLSERKIFQVAREVGVDLERARRDMNSPEIAQVIARNKELAQVLNVRGTPAFVIGDQIVPGAVPIGRLRDLIARARKQG